MALLAVATIMRLYRLNSGMWLDEILTYINYARLPFPQILKTFDSENQHFLYSILAHTSFLLFGESAWALRLPAVLFGVGSIAALYLLGCEVSTPREAFLSAALLTFSYHHIWFSQDGRGYTGLLFWAIISSWLLLRGLRETRLLNWLIYGVTAALGIYTHLTMAFLVISHFILVLVVIISSRIKNKAIPKAGITLGFGLAVILTMVFYSPVFPQIIDAVTHTHNRVANAWLVPYWTLLKVINYIKILKIDFAAFAVGLVAFLIFCVGWFSYVRSKPVVLGFLLLPLIIGTAIVTSTSHYLWPRFFFFLVGFGVLVVIRGVMEFGYLFNRLLHLSTNYSLRSGTIFCGILILTSALTVPFVYGPKQDYAGALNFIEANRQPGDVVVAIGPTGIPYRDFYDTDWKIVTTIDDLYAFSSQAKRTWLLYTLPSVLKAEYPGLLENVLENFSVMDKFPGTLGEGTIFVCMEDRLSSILGNQMINLFSNPIGWSQSN
jgi:mannosyltransferase